MSGIARSSKLLPKNAEASFYADIDPNWLPVTVILGVPDIPTYRKPARAQPPASLHTA
jgi:hypothetical protein